ncbi:MAG: 3-dehydroshikimate dehydratase [Bathelium mastoideum]|nr:MAG: 3-dehydroshikimate dehydratase [Bathelium mastoideum]KAI9689832.1 MAG: 3-dehydroshikimate dehydratase [Bathelium mastoideum]
MAACKLAISSMSLGRCFAGHTLSHKLDMAEKYGYQGIELFHEDLLDVATMDQHTLSDQHVSQEPSANAQLIAARHIRQMCNQRGLQIVCLQPFMHYEGLLDRSEHEHQLQKLALWIQLAHTLGTDLIQVPSNFLPADQVSEDATLMVKDLRKLAHMGLRSSPPIRFAYESLCWGTHVDTWERCWDLVRRVDCANFGMCLDTFNIAGRIFADPASLTGRTLDADEAVRRSIARLVAEVDVRKVFYVQVVDAERLEQPLIKHHPFYDATQPARMSWSRNCRLFYGEKEYGAYLPVQDVAVAIFHGLGFGGWVSLELFNRRMSDGDADVPEELARRGAKSWHRLVQDLKLKVEPTDPPSRIFASL